MERAGSFTAVSGAGIVAIGVLAVATTFVAGRMATAGSWVWVWVAAAALAVVIELTLTSRKSRA